MSKPEVYLIRNRCLVNKLHTYLLLGSSFLLFCVRQGWFQSKEQKEEGGYKFTAPSTGRSWQKVKEWKPYLYEQEVLLSSTKNESPLPKITATPSEIDTILEKLVAETEDFVKSRS